MENVLSKRFPAAVQRRNPEIWCGDERDRTVGLLSAIPRPPNEIDSLRTQTFFRFRERQQFSITARKTLTWASLGGIRVRDRQLKRRRTAMDIDDLRRRADAGNVAAQSILGVLYLEGGEIDLNYAEALRLLSGAAAKGASRAMLNLARMYHEGIGCPRTPSKQVAGMRRRHREESFSRRSHSPGCTRPGRLEGEPRGSGEVVWGGRRAGGESRGLR